MLTQLVLLVLFFTAHSFRKELPGCCKTRQFLLRDSLFDFKLAAAEAIAQLSPPYDKEKVLLDALNTANRYPVVMFSWKNSPACKKAKELLAVSSVSPFVVELDDDFKTGNPIRAVLVTQT